MLARDGGRGDTSVRLTALVIAAVLAVPAALALMRPGRVGDPPAGDPPRRRLDLVWAAVPAVLLVVLGVLSAAA